MARAKDPRSQVNEAELVNKLAYRFDENIRVAVITRGVSRLEDLLVLPLSRKTSLPRVKVQVPVGHLKLLIFPQLLVYNY